MLRSFASRSRGLSVLGDLKAAASAAASTVAAVTSSTLFVASAGDEISKETLNTTRNVLMPLNEHFVGPLSRKTDDRIPLPVILVIGNHSSGKSTFINHCMQRRIQQAGVAPTDDGFTIILPGQKDDDQDGPSLVGDPDMGFSSLRSFGPSLVHHTRLKLRSGLAMNDVILIDSPGMIDSPTDSISYVGAGKGRKDRGYDFEGVVRWLAERSDVILLFFDPDKPGTTGETLSVLTNSLAGMDHKFILIMNKVDMFERATDFARSYGALCWNLSKVIPRKDLPRIYTTSTPLDTEFTSPDGDGSEFTGMTPSVARKTGATFAGGPSAQDLEANRKEIMRELKLAPLRRVDNMITSLYDQTKLLKMHLDILEDVRLDYQRDFRKATLTTAGFGASGLALGVLPLFIFGPDLLSFTATIAVGTGLGAFGHFVYAGQQLEKRAKLLVEDDTLDSFFRRKFAREIAEKDESVMSLWHRIRPQVKAALESFGVAKIPKSSSSSHRQLDDILNKQVPTLRRRAAQRLGKVGGVPVAAAAALAAAEKSAKEAATAEAAKESDK